MSKYVRVYYDVGLYKDAYGELLFKEGFEWMKECFVKMCEEKGYAISVTPSPIKGAMRRNFFPYVNILPFCGGFDEDGVLEGQNFGLYNAVASKGVIDSPMLFEETVIRTSKLLKEDVLPILQKIEDERTSILAEEELNTMYRGLVFPVNRLDRYIRLWDYEKAQEYLMMKKADHEQLLKEEEETRDRLKPNPLYSVKEMDQRIDELKEVYAKEEAQIEDLLMAIQSGERQGIYDKILRENEAISLETCIRLREKASRSRKRKEK